MLTTAFIIAMKKAAMLEMIPLIPLPGKFEAFRILNGSS
jgi:hypothetical protein